MTTPIVPTPDSTDNLKRCSKCGELKPREAFSRNRTKPDGLQYQCKQCQSAAGKKWRDANPDKVRANNAANYYADLELSRNRSKKWREENIEYSRAKQREYMRQYRIDHPDYMRRWLELNDGYKKQYDIANAERIHQQRQKYYQTENGRSLRRARWARRRARKTNAEGSFTASDIEAIRIAQGNRCYICHKKLKKYHIDHFIPLALGGTNDPGNLRLACPKCNMSKNAKHPHDMGILI